MSKAEILAELPKLSDEERQEIMAQLWQIDEAAGPTVGERLLLDEAQAAYAANPTAGAPWSEVQARLRQSS